MALLNRFLKTLLIILVLVGAGWAFVTFYPYIFSKTIDGKIVKIEKIDLNVAIMQNANPQEGLNKELYSFAVGIETPDGVIHTASTEDRQWAALSPGQCVRAKYFPYPPWKLDKSGTYYGARVLESRNCN